MEDDKALIDDIFALADNLAQLTVQFDRRVAKVSDYGENGSELVQALVRYIGKPDEVIRLRASATKWLARARAKESSLAKLTAEERDLLFDPKWL